MGAGSFLFSLMGEREPVLRPYDTQFSERGRGCSEWFFDRNTVTETLV